MSLALSSKELTLTEWWIEEKSCPRSKTQCHTNTLMPGLTHKLHVMERILSSPSAVMSYCCVVLSYPATAGSCEINKLPHVALCLQQKSKHILHFILHTTSQFKCPGWYSSALSVTSHTLLLLCQERHLSFERSHSRTEMPAKINSTLLTPSRLMP